MKIKYSFQFLNDYERNWKGTEVVVGGHHGEMPYFKVSSGSNGTRRFFINELEVGN